MGAASADMVYGAIAAFGLTAISGLLVENAFWLRVGGGAFLLYLGVKTLLEKPPINRRKPKRADWAACISPPSFLTISNPMTILSFAAIFAGTMIGETNASPPVMVAGVFAGSATWWLTLSFGVGILRDKLTATHMAWINRISGGIIIVFGIYALTSAFG